MLKIVLGENNQVMLTLVLFLELLLKIPDCFSEIYGQERYVFMFLCFQRERERDREREKLENILT
jgi:hypothetical protein